MPGGGIPEGRLDQRLIVRDANAIDAREDRRDFTKPRVGNELGHASMRVGKPDALGENLRVVIVGIGLIGESAAIAKALRYRVVGHAPPNFKLRIVKKILNR